MELATAIVTASLEKSTYAGLQRKGTASEQGDPSRGYEPLQGGQGGARPHLSGGESGPEGVVAGKQDDGMKGYQPLQGSHGDVSAQGYQHLLQVEQEPLTSGGEVISNISSAWTHADLSILCFARPLVVFVNNASIVCPCRDRAQMLIATSFFFFFSRTLRHLLSDTVIICAYRLQIAFRVALHKVTALKILFSLSMWPTEPQIEYTLGQRAPQSATDTVTVPLP